MSVFTAAYKTSRETAQDVASMSVCVSVLNWLAFVLIIFATVSPWWVFGYYSGETPPGSAIPADSYYGVSASPLYAGYAVRSATLSSEYLKLCPGCPVKIDVTPVYWTQITTEDACNTTSQVYRKWSQPLGYCKTQSDGTQKYSGPSQPVDTLNLLIAACVFSFLYSALSCFAVTGYGGKAVYGATLATATVTWILIVAAFALWANWSWVQQVTTRGAWMPVWVLGSVTDNSGNVFQAQRLAAAPTEQVLGSGFGTAIAAFVVYFLTSLWYAYLIFAGDDAKEEGEEGKSAAPAGGAPGGAAMQSV